MTRLKPSGGLSSGSCGPNETAIKGSSTTQSTSRATRNYLDMWRRIDWLAPYRAPFSRAPETGQAQYFFKKTAATRGHHKSPDSTPGWPSRPLQKSQAARRHANPNEPRQHLRYAASHEALEATNNKHCPGGKPSLLFCCCHNCAYTAQPGDVNNPTPTALGQPAAFLSCTHTPATSNAGSVCATPSLKATFQPTCVVTMPTTDNALSAAKMLEPVPVVTQTPAFVVTNASTVAPESESRITASALPSAALAAIPTGSAPGLATVNAESPEKSVLKSGVPLVPTGLPTIIWADDTPTEMDFAASQGNDDDASHPEGSWTTVSANRKPASTARPRTELITVGIQLPPGTLTPKLPLYDLLASIIAAANLSPKTSAEVTLQAKPAQSLVFLKTHSPLTAHLLLSLTNLELNGKPIAIKPYAPNPPISCLGVIHNVGGYFTSPQLLHDLESFTTDILAARMMGSTESVLITFSGTGTVLTSALSTAFRPSAAAVQHLYPPILLLTFVPNRGASIAK
ncbi:hypothetical protein MTO96_020569 [Rhipicephalus appendiculatus]